MNKRVDENLIEEKTERLLKVINNAARNDSNAIYGTDEGAAYEPTRVIQC